MNYKIHRAWVRGRANISLHNHEFRTIYKGDSFWISGQDDQSHIEFQNSVRSQERRDEPATKKSGTSGNEDSSTSKGGEIIACMIDARIEIL